MFCLKMPPVLSDPKKIFLGNIKIGEESMKLIGYKGSKDFQTCPRARNWTEFFPSSHVSQIKKIL